MGVQFINRRHNECAYPTEGRGASMIVCGAPIFRRSYCPHHFLLAYNFTREPPRVRNGLNDLDVKRVKAQPEEAEELVFE